MDNALILLEALEENAVQTLIHTTLEDLSQSTAKNFPSWIRIFRFGIDKNLQRGKIQFVKK